MRIAQVRVEVGEEVGRGDVHSGVWGGAAPNACTALARLLAGLHEDQDSAAAAAAAAAAAGLPPRPAVAGLMSSGAAAAPLNASDVADVRAFCALLPPSATGTTLLTNDAAGCEAATEARWFRPTLDVVGMSCGYSGPGVKTAIPAAAAAKLSVRLVAGQSPDDAFAALRDHLLASATAMRRRRPGGAAARSSYPIGAVTVTRLGGACWAVHSPRQLLTNRVAAAVSAEVHDGAAPLFLRDGATIPALTALQRQLGLHATKWGWGLGRGVHAPNERVPAAQWAKGRQAWARLLLALGSSVSEGSVGFPPPRAGGGGGVEAAEEECARGDDAEAHVQHDEL